MTAESTQQSTENDYPEPDALDQRWFQADSEQWAEVVRLLERAPEPKPRLAALLRKRGMFASQRPSDVSTSPASEGGAPS